MTLNDLKLNESCLEVRHLAEKLPYYMRNGMVSELDKAICEIVEKATRAGYQLNDLRYKKGPNG